MRTNTACRKAAPKEEQIEIGCRKAARSAKGMAQVNA
jgi:hypothetical protein